MQVTNEWLGQLEAAQIDTNNQLATLETSVGEINTSLEEILQCLEEVGHATLVANTIAATNGNLRNNNDDLCSEVAANNDNYAADSELDDVDTCDRHRLRFNHISMGSILPRRKVRDNDESLGMIKFTMPPFDGKYDPDAYLTWELAVDQKFDCHDFSEGKRVRAATSEFTDFASVWWSEYRRKNPNNTPQTWDALKRIMRARFVPSYYARDLLYKLQQLRQGSKSVEE